MSPEVAESVRKQPCPRCGANTDERCRTSRGPVVRVHQARVLEDLFKPTRKATR